MIPTTIQLIGACIFAIALAHVMLTSRIAKLAHRYPTHAGIFHLLGEVEIVFGLWAAVLFGINSLVQGSAKSIEQLETLDFKEPLFVAVAMIVAGSSPILQAASGVVKFLACLLPLPSTISFAIVAMGVAPLLGSFITEPAAMTIAALLLRERILIDKASLRLRYAAIAVLFVNISVGGVLTNFAAPPVLMVASRWGWDSLFMAKTFGIHAVATVFVNTVLFVGLFWKQLATLPSEPTRNRRPAPVALVTIHLCLLVLIIVSAHHPVLFIGLFLLFLGVVHAYHDNHAPLLLREGLLVGFFLAGLVILGSPQAWWLAPLVAQLGDHSLFLGTAALTAVIDNAALTYLGSLLPGTSDSFRYFLLAGAVAGGGLTVIANAPNPAGASILRDRFPGGILENGKLFLYALPPTFVALAAFAIR